MKRLSRNIPANQFGSTHCRRSFNFGLRRRTEKHPIQEKTASKRSCHQPDCFEIEFHNDWRNCFLTLNPEFLFVQNVSFLQFRNCKNRITVSPGLSILVSSQIFGKASVSRLVWPKTNRPFSASNWGKRFVIEHLLRERCGSTPDIFFRHKVDRRG